MKTGWPRAYLLKGIEQENEEHDSALMFTVFPA